MDMDHGQQETFTRKGIQYIEREDTLTHTALPEEEGADFAEGGPLCLLCRGV